MVKLLSSAVILTRETLPWGLFQAVICLQKDRGQHSRADVCDRTDWLPGFPSSQTFRLCNSSAIRLLLTHTSVFQNMTLVCVHRQHSVCTLLSSNFHFPIFSEPTFPCSCSAAVDRTRTASLPALSDRVQSRFRVSSSNTEQRQTTHGFISSHFKNTLDILESSAALFLEEKRQTLNQERVTFSCLFQSCWKTS